MELPFVQPKLSVYQNRIQKGLAPVAALRLVVVGKSGMRHAFTLHTYSPFFEDTPRHYFTPCGRFIVMRHSAEINDELVRAGEQYHVYYNGTAIPEERYALSRSGKPRQHRPAAAYRRTRGIDASVTETMRQQRV